jgi:thiamine kinase-like enzyme
VLADLLREVWPDVPLRELSVEKIHTGRTSDHYRVHHRERSMILRNALQGDGVVRHVAALTALARQSFTPDFHGDRQAGAKRHLILMEDMGGRPLTAPDVEARASELIKIVRGIHENESFQTCVDDLGLDAWVQDEPPEWFETSLAFARDKAPDDERLMRAERWLETSQKQSANDLITSVMVYGHGDLHRDNWLLTQRGVVLIDWEDVGRGPLANELASLIVFGHLEPRGVAELYGVPEGYNEAVERSAAQYALYLYVYWLRKLLEDEEVDAADLAFAETLCEQYFG